MVQLTQREQLVLTAIIEDYIQSAQPVASGRVKYLANVDVSPATIRSTMAALENYGHLSHPHTSAGRVPTDFGYRAYVDELMGISMIGNAASSLIQRQMEEISGGVDSLMQILSVLIAQLTGSVGVAVGPISPSARLVSIGLVPADAGRILMVLETDSNNLRTVAIQTEKEITPQQITTVEEILRDRLCGLTLKEIVATVGERLTGTLAAEVGFGGFVLEHSEDLIAESSMSEVASHGLHNVLKAPDFFSRDNAANLASLVEDIDQLRTLVVQGGGDGGPYVTIGSEHESEKLNMLAVIRRGYYFGENLGTLAVLAPTRVNYRQVCSVLDYLASALTRHLGNENQE